MGHLTLTVAALLLLVVSAYSHPSQIDNESGTQNLVASSREKRASVQKYTQRWPDGIIPYALDARFNNPQWDLIKEAMEAFHTYTCIKFVPHSGQRDYLVVRPGDVCDSQVGYTGGRHYMNLKVPGCMHRGKIMHELMHAIGFVHEHSRFDRDNYVFIDRNNIQQGTEFNFDKIEQKDTLDLGVPYDLNSIMHYGNISFAVDTRKPTIYVHSNQPIGQRANFSPRDILSINLYYNCPGRAGRTNAQTNLEPWHDWNSRTPQF